MSAGCIDNATSHARKQRIVTTFNVQQFVRGRWWVFARHIYAFYPPLPWQSTHPPNSSTPPPCTYMIYYLYKFVYNCSWNTAYLMCKQLVYQQNYTLINCYSFCWFSGKCDKIIDFCSSMTILIEEHLSDLRCWW